MRRLVSILAICGLLMVPLPAAADTEDLCTPQSDNLWLEISTKERMLYVNCSLGDGTAETIGAYPIAVPKPGYRTQPGWHRIINMFRDVSLINSSGVLVPAGPHSPLGKYVLEFYQAPDGSSQAIHGNSMAGSVEKDPQDIQRPVSHGCIRMRNRDIERLIHWVKVGTRVRVD